MGEPNSRAVVSSAINVYKPGPLPVINAVCEESGLVKVLNQQLSWDETQCLLSPGDAIKALIMNYLTEGQPMYRLPEFFQETDTENLFGEDIDADHLNDHRLGRALDSLSAAEPSTVLGTVLLEAASREDLSAEVVHADTTSFSVHGHYDPEEDDSTDDVLSITHGFSKDNRPDLKQFNIGLGVNRTGVPVFGQILDRNASDKTWNTELIGELRQWLDTDELPVYVADSAAVTEATLDKAVDHELDLISRLPAIYSAVDERIDRACKDNDWTNLGTFSDDGDATEYKLQTFQRPIHDHELRCLVVHSSSLADRARQRIDDDFEDTEDDLEDAVVQLVDRVFSCEPDAEAALDEFLDDHDEQCFDIEAEVYETEQKKSRDGPGRPPKDWEPYKTVYKIADDDQRDAATITECK